MFRSIFKFVAVLAAMVATPAFAGVSATFTTGAIAEYSGTNANRNDKAKSFATLGITNIVMSQAGDSWGGSQGNDLSVSLKITFSDTTILTVNNAVLNWQNNKTGGGVEYFGVTTSAVVPDADDRFTRTTNSLKKTYILRLPSGISVSDFNSLIPSSTDGSANFSAADIFAALQLDFPAAVAPTANNAPSFTSKNAGGGTSYSFDYAENSATGAVIGTVSASDPENNTLTFSISGGNDDNWYAINSSTGAITLTAAGAASLANDFERTPNTQTLTVSVSDGANVTTVEVALNETNVNEGPAFTGTNAKDSSNADIYSFNYAENSVADAIVGTVAATDPEGSGVTFSITAGNTNLWYAIDASSGVITLTTAGAASLANDYEATPNVQTLTVSASDGVTPTTIEVRLNETNVNDGAPAFTGKNAGSGTSYSFNYAENSTNGAVVGTVTATDPDGGSLTFSITGGNTNLWYAINPTTGAITLTPAGAASLANDFEQTPNTQTLTVSVSDGTTATTVQIALNETNTDDTAAAITGPSGGAGAGASVLSINEGLTYVTRLEANEPVTWSITAGNDRGKFQIAADGTITFVAAPDFEAPADSDTNNTYVLTVTATDAAGNISTQTVTVTILDVDDTAPVITGPNGGPGAAASAITLTEGLTAVTRFTANEPATWSIDGGTDAGKFRIDPATGAIIFVAAPDFENPTDTDRNNTYVVRIKAVDAAGNASYQTLTVTIINVDEIARKLGQIGDKLRGSLRNYAAAGLSDMLAFNESLMVGNDDVCVDPKAKKPLSGSARANEKGGSVDVQYAQRLSDCSRPHQIFADVGLTYSRMGGNWNSRIFSGLRFETKVNSELTVGLGALVSRSSDNLNGFDTSSISDKSLQINAYGRYNISDTLRTGGFVGLGKSWYDFALTESDGFDLDGKMTGKRQIVGVMLSGDFNLGETVVTTDAIISHAREKLGSATLAARYLGENRSGIAFAVGTVDVTRISVPVTAPITLTGSADYGSWSRLLLSPGLLCEDNDVQSSAMRCGYQLGAKLVAYDGGRSRLYANYQWESVAGMRRAVMGVGAGYRVGKRNDLELALEVNRGAVGFARQDSRAMLAIRLAQ